MKLRENEMGGAYGTLVLNEKCIQILVDKPEERKPL
jgi:hypothetical protein